MARWEQATEASSIPEWFFEAVETPCETGAVEVEDCDVAWRAWGQADQPGLLLIHGMNAHARWWDFIAPALAAEHRVVAMDLTGMGDSDYRYQYSAATYAAEILGVCEATSLGDEVILVGHSFGGKIATQAANLYPGRFGALILVDSGMRHPDEPEIDLPPMGGRAKVYPDKASGMARFRLQPPQPCENAYILQYIARHSLMPADGGGWTWKFDEDLLATLVDFERKAEDYQRLSLPVGMIHGARSRLFTDRTRAHMQSLLPGAAPAVAIADAAHHVFLDQPLAFIDALQSMLSRLHSAGKC